MCFKLRMTARKRERKREIFCLLIHSPVSETARVDQTEARSGKLSRFPMWIAGKEVLGSLLVVFQILQQHSKSEVKVATT